MSENARSTAFNGSARAVDEYPFSSKWQLSVHGGWSRLLAKTSGQVPTDFRDYMKRLKSGYHLGGGLAYFWSETLGAGIQYSRFATSGEIHNVTATDQITGETRHGSIKDDINVNFFGPSLHSRYIIANGKLAINANIAIGYFNYLNNSHVVGDDIKITGSNLGTSVAFDLDVPISKQISFNLGAGLFNGVLRKVRRQGGGQDVTVEFENNERENLGRIDVSAGLNIRF